MTPQEFRAIRIDLGLTQQDLAVVMGYSSAGRVSIVENADTVPTQVGKLMEAYRSGYRPDNWPG